jgi:hypothetical protein
MLDTQAFTAGAVECPHAEERARQTVWVKDPQGTGPAMALCARCRVELTRLVTARPRPQYAEVLATMAALGYGEEEARQLWRELQEDAS